MATELASIIGEDEGTASMYLEMAGGDLDAAVAMFFSMQDPGMADGGPTTGRPSGRASAAIPDYYSMVWPSPNDPIPEAWLGQSLAFTQGLDLPQPKNGPCGVLAAWQAAVIARCHRSKVAAFFAQGPSFSPPPSLLAATLADILIQALPASKSSAVEGCGEAHGAPPAVLVRVCQWAGAPGGEVEVEEVSSACRADLEAALIARVPTLLHVPGAAVLLVYSAVLTRGLEHVKQDAGWTSPGSGESLVVGPMRTCGMELVSLLLSGRADPDVLAYDPVTRKRRNAWARTKVTAGVNAAASAKSGAEATTRDDGCEAAGAEEARRRLGDVCSWYGALGVGLLSHSEREAQQPIADDLKTPALPVWVLHGGDHFTTLFSCEPPVDASTDGAGGAAAESTSAYPIVDGSAEGISLVWHWNGLPPAGPRRARLALSPPQAENGDGRQLKLRSAEPAPATMASPYRKPKQGEVEDVVQAHPVDKAARPKVVASWRFEVVLAKDEESKREDEKEKDAMEVGTSARDVKEAKEKAGKKAAEEKEPEADRFDFRAFPAEGGGGEGAPQGWRCANCYVTRFKTFCFGVNPASTAFADGRGHAEDVACAHCGKPRSVGGWAVWLDHASLPRDWQRTVANRYGPPIVPLLRTKWPDATVTLVAAATKGDAALNDTLPSV